MPRKDIHLSIDISFDAIAAQAELDQDGWTRDTFLSYVDQNIDTIAPLMRDAAIEAFVKTLTEP